MAEFRVEKEGDDGYGRLGTLDVPNGPVETPALFPVINLIGGTTKKSGGVWRRMRDQLIARDHLQGIMFQAMSFTDYGVSPDNLNEFWRQQTFHERFKDLNAPVFIDSGGFKLMNSNTFGAAPDEGGAENDWGLYTNPESILGLQVDFGGDIIATLDYPIPPKLNEKEKMERMERSIDSAVECLKLIEDPTRLDPETLQNEEAAARFRNGENLPGVYVALHGHDYETVNWYVANFLDRIESENVSQSFEGFAIGSLVPLRSSVDVLVDIVQGAKDAIPRELEDEVGLHVFGVGGKQVGLLSLLGADSFDCSSHMQTAQYKKYLIPETWEHVKLDDLEEHLDGDKLPCTLEHCTLCGSDSVLYERTPDRYDGDTPFEILLAELSLDLSYDERQERKARDEWIKSDYYAALARHNFEVYNEALTRVREAIAGGRLLEHVVDFARDHPDIKKGLKQAQVRDKKLRRDLEALGATDLLVGPELTSDQKRLTDWGGGIDELDETRSISLEYGPNSFNILTQKYEPPADKDVLLFIPCSQEKPYGNSRTHSVLMDKLGDRRDRVHKVTVSGMYGPVPEEKEREKPVMEYEYVLANEDTEQIQLVTDRILAYLEQYGDKYDYIVGYVASKNYREAIESAINEYGDGVVLPKDPRALQLTEHFRNSNIQQLLDFLDERPQA